MEFEKVKQVILENMDSAKGKEITMDTSFTDDLGADSLDVVQIVMGLEDAFNIEIPDDAAEEIKTVGDVVNAIHKATGNQG